MWISTYHRFLNRAAFLEACQNAGWSVNRGEPELPTGVAVDVVGALAGLPSIGEDDMPVAGEVLDPRYHVNLAWHGRDPDPVFLASLVVPATPSRAWDLTTPPTSQPPVSSVIPAWKGKAALREAGLLDAVEAAVAEAGGRVQDAWSGASEWSRDSDFLLSLAAGLGLSNRQIDELFRTADAIES